ncbi:hypothetical protein Naga_100291g5 [Nannochloropsis gaditana]|uniref:Uncharacterized protein n=1 Tax=Nannochloropsis gaditana TaxID=72520 RepID=W7TFB1_9STRA|nr:hypothetical protein Naga_100291g5 [Nannochloropsis gaditana]
MANLRGAGASGNSNNERRNTWIKMGGVALLLLGVVVVAVTLGLERRTDKSTTPVAFEGPEPSASTVQPAIVTESLAENISKNDKESTTKPLADDSSETLVDPASTTSSTSNTGNAGTFFEKADELL